MCTFRWTSCSEALPSAVAEVPKYMHRACCGAPDAVSFSRWQQHTKQLSDCDSPMKRKTCTSIGISSNSHDLICMPVARQVARVNCYISLPSATQSLKLFTTGGI